jgi:hypothetical protein
MREITEQTPAETRLAAFEANPVRVLAAVDELLTEKLQTAAPVDMDGLLRQYFTLGSILRTPQAERLAKELDIPVRLILGRVGRIVLQKKTPAVVREVEQLTWRADAETYEVWFNETSLAETREVANIKPADLMNQLEVLADADMLDVPLDMGWR